MKRIFLSFILVLFVSAGFSQVLKPVKIDSLLTISLPVGYQKKDTLNQKIFSGTGSLGYMIVIRAINAGNIKPLNKETDLNKALNDYINGINKQASGNVLNARDTIIGTLKAKVFTLQTDNNGDVELRNFILIYTHNITYTIEYVYLEKRQNLIKDELKAFVSSIKLSPQLQRSNQYTKVGKAKNNFKLPIYGGGALIIIIIAFMVLRRKKKGKS